MAKYLCLFLLHLLYKSNDNAQQVNIVNSHQKDFDDSCKNLKPECRLCFRIQKKRCPLHCCPCEELGRAPLVFPEQKFRRGCDQSCLYRCLKGGSQSSPRAGRLKPRSVGPEGHCLCVICDCIRPLNVHQWITLVVWTTEKKLLALKRRHSLASPSGPRRRKNKTKENANASENISYFSWKLPSFHGKIFDPAVVKIEISDWKINSDIRVIFTKLCRNYV